MRSSPCGLAAIRVIRAAVVAVRHAVSIPVAVIAMGYAVAVSVVKVAWRMGL